MDLILRYTYQIFIQKNKWKDLKDILTIKASANFLKVCHKFTSKWMQLNNTELRN